MTVPSYVSRHQDLDPRYVAARRVLLDALTVLASHGDAIILAGAQAVYLHTGTADPSWAACVGRDRASVDRCGPHC